ncbi:MAG TPA: DUF885 domain-containing protein [Verrucomicrobiae bacterium]|jgi:uncharacterized protein (DUF885 family)|nr:DUF885 domain-containing protein [Verrucomicrobiae bacterium]
MRILLLLSSCLLLAGCAGTGPNSTAPSSEADTVFNQLADDYIGGFLAWRPQTGTALGLHQYDGKITDCSRASIDAELARLKSFEQQLVDIDFSRLSPQCAYDYRILHGAIQHEIFNFEQLHAYTENPMTYAGAIDLNIYIKRDFAPLPDRVRSIISILNQTSNVMAAARANLDESLPRPFIETAIDQAGGAADFLGTDLVNALKDVPDTTLMAEFNAANTRAIAELRGYVTYLKEQKLPKANDNFALGRENYMKLLQYGEMVTNKPEDLLDLGLNELWRKEQVFKDTAHLIDPTNSPIEVFKAIQKEHPTEESLIPDSVKDLETIRQFVIDHNIVTVPSQVRVHVTETPQYLRATSFASMDTPGPFETKATEAYYYITPVESNWPPEQKEQWLTAFNYYTTDIVSIHEAYPGHYIAFLHLNASSATPVEKIFSGYAFTEGWAHYCEQMLVDEGFGADPSAAPGSPAALKAAKYRLAQTDEALLRICRLCVSIKMHCQGMTVPEATRFFQDNCYYELGPAHSEAVRGTFDPEYLYYTLGKIEILNLRDDYKKQEGANFSLQKFHDELLAHGAPPVRLMREMMLKDRADWDKVL